METVTLILMVVGIVYTVVDAPEKARKTRHYGRLFRQWLRRRREHATRR